MQKIILDTTKDWKDQFRIVEGSRYTFPSEVRISWEALKELVEQQFESGEKAREKEIDKAKNFIKYLLHSKGGSITLMLDPSFEPKKFEIVRQSVVGNLAEIISLEPLNPTKEGEE